MLQFLRIIFWRESSNEQYLFDIYIFYHIINVFMDIIQLNLFKINVIYLYTMSIL